MRFNDFYRRAQEVFETIPEEFRKGVDGLTVRAEAQPHPTLADVYTLGQCLTESFPSDWSGPETTRSVVVLFHGSFAALASLDPGFDWEGELWETLTHELRHHLETLANEDALEGVDYALDEAFRRAEGEDFDPFYYQAGEEVAPGVFQVEYDFFIEKTWTPEEVDAAREIRFKWHGKEWQIPRPEFLGDIHYVWITGVDSGPGALQVVLVRKRGWKERMKDLKEDRELELWESEGLAEGA
ncbi:hypothetical protein ACFL3S_04210 [Gemmatimonadota bacterium]